MNTALEHSAPTRGEISIGQKFYPWGIGGNLLTIGDEGASTPDQASLFLRPLRRYGAQV